MLSYVFSCSAGGDALTSCEGNLNITIMEKFEDIVAIAFLPFVSLLDCSHVAAER